MHVARVQFCPAVYQQCLHVPNTLFPHKTLEIRIGSLQSRETSMNVTENGYWYLHGPSESRRGLIQCKENDFES